MAQISWSQLARRPIRVAWCMLLSVLAACNAPGTSNFSNTTVQTLHGTSLNVDLASPNLIIKTWDRAEISVEMVQEGGTKDDYEIVVAEQAGTVSVQQRARSCNNCGKLVINIHLPASTSLAIKIASGSVTADDVVGASQIAAGSGSIIFNSPLQANTDYNLSSQSGSVQVTLASTTQANVTASSTTGKVESSIELPGVFKTRNSFAGTFGAEPSANLNITTESGSIRLTQN